MQCTGIGLHSGEPVDLTLKPAAAGTGILFVRTDGAQPVRFPARAEWVTDTTLATTLGNEDSRLSTIEHLVSALRGMGIDNCTVEVSGPELPIMDGSAASFVYLIQQAGIRSQARMRRRIVIRRPIEVRDGNRYVRVDAVARVQALGRDRLRASRRSVGRRSTAWSISPELFAREIAPARTFGFLKDTQRLQAIGLARGGSLANAIVLDETHVLNAEGLRFRDEFARHKVLDLIGDLALLGVPLQGHVKAVRGGHQLHQALVAEIRANPSCWTLETPSSEREPVLEGAVLQPVPGRI